MEFYKCIKEFKGIKPKQIAINSHYHWYRTIIVADAKNKTVFHNYHLGGFDFKQKEFFTPLTMKELNKLKPHLYKMLLIDYRISFNQDCLDKLPISCCYQCASNTFGTTPELKNINSIGKCLKCGKEKQNIFNIERFKIDIFGR
jgi:hypothetical protein